MATRRRVEEDMDHPGANGASAWGGGFSRSWRASRGRQAWPSFDSTQNRALSEAIALYRKSGYLEVDAFNDEPYAQHWFEKRLS
jgi:hypothetical protein